MHEPAHQALREDAEQRVGEIERVHAHVEQADDDSGALLVCSVANTRWPVSEASMPIERGLLVAHLAHHDDVRVGAQERRIAAAKVKPIFGFICTWRRPFCVISTGSSAVQILVSGVLSEPSTECSVVVLPEPVGPQTKNRP